MNALSKSPEPVIQGIKKSLDFQNLINYKNSKSNKNEKDYWRRFCQSFGRSTALGRVAGNSQNMDTQLWKIN